MDEDRREARVRFDEGLAGRGERPLSDAERTWYESAFGNRLERLDTGEFREAVDEIVARRADAHIFLRHVRSMVRTDLPPADSPLAGDEWPRYLETHLDCVLASFAWLRDQARLELRLRPLGVGAPSTRRAAWAWLTGDRRWLSGEKPDEELPLLADCQAAHLWLAGYASRLGDPGGSEVVLWRGFIGEDTALPFPASCHELRNLRDLARRIATATGCREVEAMEWLLADVRPPRPPA